MVFNQKNKKFYSKGTTLIETLIAVAFFVGVSTAIYGVYGKILELTRVARMRDIIATTANEYIEIIRNLPYADVGVEGGVPDGVIPYQQNITRNGYTMRIQTFIENVDQDFDGTVGGTPNDDMPADAKLVEIRVQCIECDTYYNTMAFTALISPKNMEFDTNSGALYVYVIDANGDPLPNIDLDIDNASESISINDQTGADGVYKVIGAPSGTRKYRIQATKSGYTFDSTYLKSNLGGSTPVLPHASVIDQEITSITMVVDRVSNIQFSSVDEDCNAIGAFDFQLTGEKLLGTNPTYLKYNQSLVTNASGIKNLSNVEWDTYSVTSIDSVYDLIGSNPLLEFSVSPNSTQSMQLVVAPKDQPTLLVSVKDGSTGLALSDVTVDIDDGAGYTDSAITGKGSKSQTDWSGSSGVATSVPDGVDYFSSDSNLELRSPEGDMKLRYQGGVYLSSGYLISSTYDTGSASNFSEITWNPYTQPAEAGAASSVRFQIATNNDYTTWNFLGPDGTNATYYTYGDQAISSVHNGDRYLRYKVYLSTDNTAYTPTVSDIGFTYTTNCTPPGQVVFQSIPTGNYTITSSKTDYNTDILSFTVGSTWQQAEVTLTE
ncbi:MAG: hypothetical protein H6791_03220 [Candidatus Nomurabacteria bacterium]|nr:MAG: hypothetical protein H6791_03220 [Candidatus Nomurabacteria bacterium]